MKAKQVTDPSLAAYFDPAKHVYSDSDLKQLHEIFVAEGRIRRSMSLSRFAEWATKKKILKEIPLKCSHGPIPKRYSTEQFSPYELALSLRRNAYLSHRTAAFLLGLANEESQILYVNKEQSEKRAQNTSASLTQEDLNLAFSEKQRQSKYRVESGNFCITLLSGKYSGNLGVQTLKSQGGGSLLLTSIERTLIDIAVRPAYGGGVGAVLSCYISAMGKASPPKLIRMLKQLNYTYPYHQAIGFYMDCAGYKKESWEELQGDLRYDFFLAHGMKKTDYSKEWRIYIPKGFKSVISADEAIAPMLKT